MQIQIDEELQRRIKLKIKISASGCWIWTGHIEQNGYGRISYKGQRGKWVHRMSFAAFKGQIPDGINVCHKCDNPPCVNPDHLFLGNDSENAKDMMRKNRHPLCIQAKKTHCIRGHLLQGNNLIINKTSGRRGCRECVRIAYREKYKNPKFRNNEKARLKKLRTK